MNVLSPTGITILGLVNNSSPATNDLLIIQNVSEGENGVTQNISVAQLSTIVASTISNENLNFINSSNTFSGSFYGTQTTIPANFYNIIARNNVTVNNNLIVAGNSTLIGTSTVTNGNLVVSTGNLTVSSGNTSLQTVSCGNITSTGTIEGTTITANTKFIGNLTGDVTGDIYSPTGEIVLQNGTGNQEDSLFYGTSSYSTKSNLVETNGVPTGGTTGQFLSKASNTNYDLIWSDTNEIEETAILTLISASVSGSSGIATYEYFPIFEHENKIKNGPLAIDTIDDKIVTEKNLFVNGDLEVNNICIIRQGTEIENGLTVTGPFTASNIYIDDNQHSYISNLGVNNIAYNYITSSDSSTETQIHATLFYNKFYELHLSQSCTVTMSLSNGQEGFVLIKQETGESNNVTWYYSTDEGDTITDGNEIKWINGTPPTLTHPSGTDLIKFYNFGNIIYGEYSLDFS